jgi:hypothetical protein
MNVDIFIRSYVGDFNWLAYCLQSCEKYASGFRSIHIAVPVNDISLLSSRKEVIHATNGWEDDYLGQQRDKLYADTFCKSEFICHLDSDCVWTTPITPEILMPNGNPVLLFEKHGENSPWPQMMNKALGWNPEYDFMRRHPFVYPKHLYGEFREWFKGYHGQELSNWIRLQPFHEFTEFNTFGAWCYKFYPECFDIRQPSEFDTFLKQYWSWGGASDFIDEINSIIAIPQEPT